MFSFGFSQNTKVQIPGVLNYDFSCIEEDDLSVLINFGSDIEKELLKNLGDPVTLSEEVDCGDSVIAELKKQGNLLQSGSDYQRIKNILSNLTPKIKMPKGFIYQIYVVNSQEINAFTIGGKIFINTAMITFCKSDDELACIIGHEIAHNELGHINDVISRLKTARNFGEVGQMSSVIASWATSSFNQKNEAHSDFVGIDLAYAAGYNGCASSILWSRMKAQEGNFQGLDTFFSSHPFSSERETCTKLHIISNYKVECE